MKTRMISGKTTETREICREKDRMRESENEKTREFE